MSEPRGRPALLVPLLLARLLGGCASAPARPSPDLVAARQELEKARAAATGVSAAEACLTRGQAHLREAEKLETSAAGQARAESLGQLTLAEARCALALAGQAESARRELAAGAAAAAPAQELEARLKRSESDQHRLEERVSLLQRNLDMTETELIRTKARLKGAETNADASAAIAEARVLMRRLLDTKGRSAGLGLCQEKLDRAEQQLEEKNYGAAVFFAAQARELLDGLRRGAEESERPAARPSYVVAVASANLRAEPSGTAPIVARLAKGTRLEAQATRGEWVKVESNGASGWILRSLLE